METARDINTYRKHWAARFGVAPFLPMSRAEMDALGWDSCDVIVVTGDAYVDHPSFGMAIIGRLSFRSPTGTAPTRFVHSENLIFSLVSLPETWTRWSIAIRAIVVFAVMMPIPRTGRAGSDRTDP
jgi:hypothetical protein